MGKLPKRQARLKKETEMADRRRKVAHFLTLRMDQKDIARILNVSTATISHDVRAIKAQWLEATKQDVGIFLARELAELESMDRTAAIKQDDGGWFDRRLRVKERKARMMGTDRQKLEVSGNDGGPIECADVRERMAARIAALAAAGAANGAVEQPE